MSPVEYGQWYYLIYLVPGGTALLTLMLSMMGGGVRHHRVGHSHGHHGGHIRIGGHGGGHRGGGGARHAGPKTTAKAGGRIKAAAGQVRASLGDQALALIGFGRIPSPFVWGSLLLGWSVFGFWATRILEEGMRHPGLFVLPAMAIAAGGAFGMARLTSGMLGRFVPQDESLAVSTIDLVGLTGEVTYPVDGSRGRVHVYDDHGTMHDCRARTASAGYPQIGRGRTVLVVDYDPHADQLIVEEHA